MALRNSMGSCTEKNSLIAVVQWNSKYEGSSSTRPYVEINKLALKEWHVFMMDIFGELARFLSNNGE